MKDTPSAQAALLCVLPTRILPLLVLLRKEASQMLSHLMIKFVKS